MKTAPRTIAPRAMLQRMSRCLVVSVGTTLLSAAILIALALGAGVPAETTRQRDILCSVARGVTVRSAVVIGSLR